MTDLQTQITNVKALLAFLENQLPKEDVKVIIKEDKPKKEKVVKEKVEAKKPNIPRMTKKIEQTLGNELKNLAQKDVDANIIKDFKTYINDDMSAETFQSDSLENHIANFVRQNHVKTSASPFAGSDSPPTMEALEKKKCEMHTLQKTLTNAQFEEKTKTSKLVPLGDGNFWCPQDGMWILVDYDNEVDDVDFKGEKYIVCKENKRVYKYDEKTDRDLFVGFVGIGFFKTMTV
jgi:hypothetical protein